MRSLCRRHFLWFPWFLCDHIKNCVAIKISFISFISAGLKKHSFFWLYAEFFVSLQCRRTMIIYVSKSKILWSHGTRDTLLSEYQADVSLAEITRTSRLRPRFGAPVATETPHVSSVGSKHYLPTLRAALNCPIFVHFGDSDFTYCKPILSCRETSTL